MSNGLDSKENRQVLDEIRAQSTRRRHLPIDTKTPWGPIGAVGVVGGERYYWMIDKHGVVSMMPACVVEEADDDGS